jgi:peptide chain release factor 3
MIYKTISIAVLIAQAHSFSPSKIQGTQYSTALFLTNDSDFKAPHEEIDRRRNLAIISHPDSGKTTMTEKLLLYGGAIQQAGAVRQKAEQRSTASDFMEMEKERGISISSTVMNFDYKSLRINILDTPGHQDFSEDTYRALAAADNAVMLLDAAKGLEPQTRKLFEVCRMRNLPLFTFVNKMDRPALTPYEIMDQIEDEFGLETHPILWPIGDGERFKGVLDRLSNVGHLYQVGNPISNQILELIVPHQFQIGIKSDIFHLLLICQNRNLPREEGRLRSSRCP